MLSAMDINLPEQSQSKTGLKSKEFSIIFFWLPGLAAFLFGRYGKAPGKQIASMCRQ